MTVRRPESPAPSDPTAAAETRPAGEAKVQKRAPKPTVATREKICATCGRTFQLAPEEKFFNCPACHRKAQPPRKAPRKGDARILTQITCQACGAQEYVAFVPADPGAALCSACFSVRRRELKEQTNHKNRR